MNLLRFAVATFALSTLIFSCKKDDNKTTPPVVTPADTPDHAKVTISFSNTVNGQPVALGPFNYTSAAGNSYSIDLLKYYISNFTLVKADGSERNFHVHELIDASKPASMSFTLDSVLNGDYTKVKFQLGVDSLHNHTGDQEGDLDPSNGMIWSWNTGYTFFKHEGFYKNTAGDTRQIVYHYGTDRSLVDYTIPISDMKVIGKDRKIHLKFDLHKAYSTPNDIDFNNDDIRMSDPADLFWMISMKENLADAFTFEKAE